ncbi:hypothetical protein HYV31_00455 [candidate division WWE3 bacterium]|nr:hypothetical protein [candidate division WWE3 bacterium]
MSFILGSKFLATYEREIENKPLNNVIFTSALATILIFVSLLFGIKPASENLAKNIKYKKELLNIERIMLEKNRKTEGGEILLRDNGEGVFVLNKKLPFKVDFDKFLEEFIMATSKSGFIVNRVNLIGVEKGEISISVELVGSLLQLPEMVEAVEQMERFTKIDWIRTEKNKTKDASILQMKVQTYIL